MDGVVFPTWADVGLSEGFASEVAQAPDHALQTLVDGRVFHNTRKVSFNYQCHTCGGTHKPERLVDDYSQCAKCQSMAITLVRSLRTPRSTDRERGYRPQPGHTPEYLDSIYEVMRDNYDEYFAGKIDPECILFTVGGREGHVYEAAFLGGTKATANNIPQVIVRAAVSVPFLWDGTFDWKTKQFRTEPGRESHLTPILYDWMKTRG